MMKYTIMEVKHDWKEHRKMCSLTIISSITFLLLGIVLYIIQEILYNSGRYEMLNFGELT